MKKQGIAKRVQGDIQKAFKWRAIVLFMLGLLLLLLTVACDNAPLVSPEDETPTPPPYATFDTLVVVTVVLDPTFLPPTPTSTNTSTPTVTSRPTSTPTPTATPYPISTWTPTAIPTSSPSDTPPSNPIPPTLYPTTTWQPPQGITSVAPDDWLTYVDQDAGYSFKYPPEIRLSGGKSKGDQFKIVRGEFPPSLEFRPWMVVVVNLNSANLTLKQYLTERYTACTRRSDVPPPYLVAMENIEINGYPAIWSKSDCKSELFIAISADNKFFNFSISNGVMVSDLRTVDDTTKDTFYDIVHSFTLVSP